ncbi:MAG: glycosyltransferase, partial [Planctomycetota bacterium]
MDVTHFNSFLRGGAATAARRLHESLRKRGVDSRFQYLSGQRSNDSLAELAESNYGETQWPSDGVVSDAAAAIRFRMRRQRFKRETAGRPSNAEIFTSPHGRPQTKWNPDTHGSRQLIHLHWISKFIDYPSFFRSIPDDQSVVWTLHDMNAFTGGCHFAGSCERFAEGCGHCPQLAQRSSNDTSRRSFRIKQAALESVDLHVAAPSRWLLQQAKRSPILRQARSFHHIPYGMPVDELFPVGREEARRQLGLSPESFVITFGAMNLSSERKGARHLVEALASVRTRDGVECLMFGAGSVEETAITFPTRHAGFLADNHQRRLTLSAADVFVLPSMEDNLPLTGVEAMSCGTPVIGFNVGGIPDYVLPGETGWLAGRGDVQQLAACLEDAISNRW